MKKLIFIILLTTLFLFIACTKNNNSLINPIISGKYSFTSYDSTGTAIVEGWITINYKNSSTINGNWRLDKIGNPQNIGPQYGNGELIGGNNNSGIWMELNPKFVDNNLYLLGTIDNNKYSGIWQWISLVGVSNHGTFEAIKD